jgi:hypothetical protein
MFGRVLTIVLIPLWIAIVLLIFGLALVVRILRGVTDLVEAIGNFLADTTKLVIETLAHL